MMKKVYIITGEDEWLTNIVIKKLSNTYSVTLIKVKGDSFNIYKMFKIIMLLGIISFIKILLIQLKRKKYKITQIKKKELKKFLKKINNNKIFLVNLPFKIKGEFKNIYNCHPSMLPNYKGLLIIQRSIYDKLFNNKNCKIGVTIHKINKDFDNGQIVWNKEIKLNFKKKYNFKKIYEEFYLNFYYGIDKILSKKKISYLKIKEDLSLKKTISFLEMIKLKLRLL
jgi:formyltetrahydrofolate hydrolase